VNPLTDNDYCGATEDCSGGEACGDGFKCDGTGVCAASCQAAFATCGDVCADLDTNVDHCGSCDTVCDVGDACSNGTCCPLGLVGADGACVNVFVDPDNCGALGNVCPSASTCRNGSCACDDPRAVPCADGCVNVDIDEERCGGCAAPACGVGEVCFGGECRTSTDLKIELFTPDNCSFIDHDSLTGDDRGGIATAAGFLYYSGDNFTGRFALDDLRSSAQFGTQHYDGMFTDFLDDRLLSFAVDGVPYDHEEIGNPAQIDGIVQLDVLTGAVIDTISLSQSVTAGAQSDVFNNSAVYAGVGRVAIIVNDVFNIIDTTTGEVTVVDAPLVSIERRCENWAHWGVLEHFGNEDAIVYPGADARGQALFRTYLRDGATEIVSTFDDLSDMCSFTVDLVRGQWLWHYEGEGGQLGTGNESEAAGACDATFCAFRDDCSCGSVRSDRCAGSCVDPQSDQQNCGACGNVCPDGPCVDGQCTTGFPGVILEVYRGNFEVLPDFSTLTLESSRVVPSISIASLSGQDGFAVRFLGLIAIDQAGVWEFETGSDDGSQLFIDGQLVVDNDGIHATEFQSGTIELTVGLHPIIVTMFDAGTDEALIVNYAPPGETLQPIPPEVLFLPDL
jgi:hypothetical protein